MVCSGRDGDLVCRFLVNCVVLLVDFCRKVCDWQNLNNCVDAMACMIKYDERLQNKTHVAFVELLVSVSPQNITRLNSPCASMALVNCGMPTPILSN